MGLQKRLDDAGSFLNRLTKRAPPAVALFDDLAKRYGLARQFLADRPAKELAILINANLSHISWVISNNHLLTHVCSQRQIQIAQALEMDSILANLAAFGYGQQQQVELLKALR